MRKQGKQEVRPVFIYLTVISVILGLVGALMIARNITGRVVMEQEIKNIYSKEEILKHNSEQDCWISMEGKVYDVTLFLRVYGDKSLKEKCGKDAESNFFNEDTKKVLEEYEIGLVK